tara:strand:- start:81 stop:851 length:771 start_codon:yes stop_codon:yes gene_type:complete
MSVKEYKEEKHKTFLHNLKRKDLVNKAWDSQQEVVQQRKQILDLLNNETRLKMDNMEMREKVKFLEDQAKAKEGITMEIDIDDDESVESLSSEESFKTQESKESKESVDDWLVCLPTYAPPTEPLNCEAWKEWDKTNTTGFSVQHYGTRFKTEECRHKHNCKFANKINECRHFHPEQGEKQRIIPKWVHISYTLKTVRCKNHERPERCDHPIHKCRFSHGRADHIFRDNYLGENRTGNWNLKTFPEQEAYKCKHNL